MGNTTKVALVTGAAGHLGRAVCARLAKDGVTVVRAERSRAYVGESAIADVDLLSAQGATALVERVVAVCGGLDVVVHTVGTFAMSGPAHKSDLNAFGALYETNVLTTVTLLRAAIASMRTRGHGRVVVVSSTAALAGGAEVAAYSASKAAQLRVVESAAAELRGTDVAVSAVLPGTMDTPPNRAAMPDADRTSWVSLDEVADVIAYLASPAAGVLNGRAIEVSRGR